MARRPVSAAAAAAAAAVVCVSAAISIRAQLEASSKVSGCLSCQAFSWPAPLGLGQHDGRRRGFRLWRELPHGARVQA